MSSVVRVFVASLVTTALLGSLAACGEDERSASPSPKTPSTSVSPTSSPTAASSASPTFTSVYELVADYVSANLPVGFPVRNQFTNGVVDSPEQESFFSTICDLVDDTQLGERARTQTINGVARQLPGKHKGDQALGEVLVETIVEGCWKTGLAERPWMFDPQDYGKFRDVLAALHEAGFDEFIERVQQPGVVGDTCYFISREPVGGRWFREERRDWLKTLTKTGPNEWGWTEPRASKFVDALFEACFATGHSKPYVPIISNGIWTIGRDVPPGTYRSNGVRSDCYWAIYRSGSNGQDIIANDLPAGGFPTVALSIGQDFSTDGCGLWKKIG